MINKLKSTLANTTIQDDDQQFIANIAILLRAITIYLLPILIGLFVWNDLFSNTSSKDGIYYALHLFSKKVNQLTPHVWCITLLVEDDFGNTTISATCFDSLDDVKEIAQNYMNLCESQYVVSDYATVGIRKSRLNVVTITPVSLVQ